MRQLKIQIRHWPVAGTFRIARNALTAIPVVTVTLSDGHHQGQAECRPYGRYDENCESVCAQIQSVQNAIETGMDRTALQSALPAGAARNALDCALWDLQAKQSKTAIWQNLKITKPGPRITAFTLSLDTPKAMAKAASQAIDYPLLKIKIGSKNSLECVLAIIKARPDATLIIDANEALNSAALPMFLKAIPVKNIALIEQPLPAGHSTPLPETGHILCADESLHTSTDLPHLWQQGYRAVNVKLDKTGGITQAHDTMIRARTMGFKVMAGCMVGSSLAMAPMVILESLADFIDLDGPLLLERDIDNGLSYKGAMVYPPTSALFG